MSQGTWHRIAAQLGWPVDASVAALRDAPPDTQRISLELARTYQKLLRPFEEVWTKSLLKQQQTLLENHRNGQQQQFGGGTGVASGPSATPLQTAAPPPLRPPSQNAQIGNNNGGATSLEASRQQLLQQAKAASLATQQLQASPAAGQAKAQLPAVAPNLTSTTTPGTATTSSSSKLNVDPTMEQMAEAKNMVSHIRQQIEASRREWKSRARENGLD